MKGSANSLAGIIWGTPLLRRIIALVLIGAIALPAYDLLYVYPSFRSLLIHTVENDARRTARHLLYMARSAGGSDALFRRGGIPAEIGEDLRHAADDLALWKTRIYSADGEIVFSTIPDEVGHRNDKGYFHRRVARGEVFSRTELKSGRSLEGEMVPLDVVEVYVPIMAVGSFRGAFEIYYDVSRETAMLESRLTRTGLILVTMTAGIIGIALLLVITTARESRRLAYTESALDAQERIFRDVINAANDGVLVTDARRSIRIVNPAFSELTGYAESELLGRTPAILKSGRHDDVFFKKMWQVLGEHKRWRGEIWNRRKDGSIFPGLVSISTIEDRDGNTSHYVGIYTDISHQKAQQAHFEDMAHHDPLTGLPNRLLFMDRLKKAMQHAQRANETVALYFLDLDGFKQVNDSAGHEAGDLLLQEVAQRLSGVVRQEDTVARFGGDEFTLLIHEFASDAILTRIAAEIIDLISAPIQMDDGTELQVGVSIGIACYPRDSDDMDKLIMLADTAMYAAKAGGRNRFYLHREQFEG